jgi:16S rRNA (guanine1516-N2)-methyltransferase
MVMINNLVIHIADHRYEQVALALAADLNVPVVDEIPSESFVLVFAAKGLELWLPDRTMKPIFIDFSSKEIRQRLMRCNPRNELLARAVGIKGHYRPKIVDATAGLAQDAILLAHFGCSIFLCERSKIMCALLKDAMIRAEDRVKNLILYCGDAREFLINTKPDVDVVYLDPMFPQRTKSALVKKEMRILKQLVGADEDAGELFILAKQVAKKRVVVKRALHAPTLTSEPPSFVLNGKRCRFDVYLTL